MSNADLIAIGRLADATGVPVTALRYYDDVGLIEACSRVGGKRRFSPDVVGRVNFVRRSQGLGFSLEEIRELLEEGNRGWRDLVDAKVQQLRNQRGELDAMIGILDEARRCGCEVIAQCQRGYSNG